MITYIIRRLLLMIPTLIGVTAVVFFVMALSPGGFGGTMLNQLGMQTSGQQAQRIKAYFMRRYGFDQPVWVQYGRWLNDVSPVGFENSAQVTFSKKTRDAVQAVFKTRKPSLSPGMIQQASTVARGLAKYSGDDPVAMAKKLNAALSAPTRGWQLYALLDAKMDDYTRQQVDAEAKRSVPEADATLLDDLQFQTDSRSRILFARPEFKMPDLGESLQGQKVTTLLAQTLPVTLLLNAVSIPLIYLIAILTGIYAAKKRGQWFDVSSSAVLLTLWSVPTIWAGVLLIGYLANDQYFNWFPFVGLHSLRADSMPFLPYWAHGEWNRGYLVDLLWHMVLPVICLSYGGFAVLAKLTRGAVLENLTADFVRTARAKGVGERDVLFRHVLRNSLLPLITVAAAILPAMLGGAVIVETIFSIHGMGKLTVDAAFQKDRELVMGTTLISGLLVLLSWLIRDVWYAIADPRVSYE